VGPGKMKWCVLYVAKAGQCQKRKMSGTATFLGSGWGGCQGTQRVGVCHQGLSGSIFKKKGNERRDRVSP